MSLWTPAIDIPRLTFITVIQGFGLGFVFIPLQVVAFATLAPDLRTDATALFSLARNVGSAIGISIMSFMLAYHTQLMHTRIGESLTPFNRMLQSGGSYLFWNVTTFGGRAALNGEVTRQALAISYSNDFLLMMWISLPTALLLLIMQRPKPPEAKAQGAGPPAAASPAHAVLD
jgi:DHA2 family multidrug resistance protein